MPQLTESSPQNPFTTEPISEGESSSKTLPKSSDTVTPADLLSKEVSHAKGNESRQDLPSVEAGGGERGQGRTHSPSADGLILGNGPPAQIPTAESARKEARWEGYLRFNEPDAIEALTLAHGDIFIASQLLEITSVRLNRAIGVSPKLQAALKILTKTKAGADEQTVRAAIEERLLLYRAVGLDALHDLAAMPIDENSAQNQVKLAAAARLAGNTGSTGDSGIEDTLRELNQAYQQHAPRLRVVRERTTIETIPEKVVSEAGKKE